MQTSPAERNPAGPSRLPVRMKLRQVCDLTLCSMWGWGVISKKAVGHVCSAVAGRERKEIMERRKLFNKEIDLRNMIDVLHSHHLPAKKKAM